MTANMCNSCCSSSTQKRVLLTQATNATQEQKKVNKWQSHKRNGGNGSVAFLTQNTNAILFSILEHKQRYARTFFFIYTALESERSPGHEQCRNDPAPTHFVTHKKEAQKNIRTNISWYRHYLAIKAKSSSSNEENRPHSNAILASCKRDRRRTYIHTNKCEHRHILGISARLISSKEQNRSYCDAIHDAFDRKRERMNCTGEPKKECANRNEYTSEVSS